MAQYHQTSRSFPAKRNNWKEPGYRSVDFDRINRAALAELSILLVRWLPGGSYHGVEYTALNPKRSDRKAGSFSINTRTGRWADFATGDNGGDVISLAAYLQGLSQVEAARSLAKMLRVST